MRMQKCKWALANTGCRPLLHPAGGSLSASEPQRGANVLRAKRNNSFWRRRLRRQMCWKQVAPLENNCRNRRQPCDTNPARFPAASNHQQAADVTQEAAGADTTAVIARRRPDRGYAIENATAVAEVTTSSRPTSSRLASESWCAALAFKASGCAHFPAARSQVKRANDN